MTLAKAKGFGSQRKGLTDNNRGAGISCSLYRVGPGKAAFPKHAHLANDEAIFMLKGKGSLTIGDETFEVAQGDYVHLPKGEGGRAHLRQHLRYGHGIFMHVHLSSARSGVLSRL